MPLKEDPMRSSCSCSPPVWRTHPGRCQRILWFSSENGSSGLRCYVCNLFSGNGL